MSIPPKIQNAPFDIADWEVDSEFGVFPQGARAKDAVFVPDPAPENVLIPGKRYLFKRSKRSYPDQFWGEVVAYRIGCLLGIEVPPAFVAFNSRTGLCAALIEWFYTDNLETFVMAGDFILKVRPDFDREKGKMHNMKDVGVLMRTFADTHLFQSDWRQWWVDALLFDALIGNTDRHQDNWGTVFLHGGFRLCPLFDNGTSLGHERFPERVAYWSDQELEHYINKGTHHISWSLDDAMPTSGHSDLLKLALNAWPETRDIARNRMEFSDKELVDSVQDLGTLDIPVRLLPERLAFMLRLLLRRHEILKVLLK